METIGRRVRALRELRGLKQGELARRIGVTQSAISQIESGLTETVRGEVLAGLCRELGAMPDYIMHGKGRAMDHETAVLMGELYRAAQRLTPRTLALLVRAARDYGAMDVPMELPPAQLKEPAHERTAKRSTRPETLAPLKVGGAFKRAGRPTSRTTKRAKGG